VGPADLGTYWVWDARLTSTLILLFLTSGFIALQAAIDDRRRADKAGAVLALVGVVNVPILLLGQVVEHAAPRARRSSPAPRRWPTFMLTRHAADGVSPSGCMRSRPVLARLRTIIIERERRAQWVLARASGARFESVEGKHDAVGIVGELPAMGGYASTLGSVSGCAGVIVAEILALRQRRRAALAEAKRATGCRGGRHEIAHKRLALIVGGLAALGVASALILSAFQEKPGVLLLAVGRGRAEAPRDRSFARRAGAGRAASARRACW